MVVWAYQPNASESVMGEAREPCPIKSCDGTLDVMATGVDANLHAIEYLVCDRCAKTVERDVPFEHPSLFGPST